MNKSNNYIIVIFILTCILFFYKNKVHSYYITYNSKPITINGVLVNSNYLNELYSYEGHIIFFRKIVDNNFDRFISYRHLYNKYKSIFYKSTYKYTTQLVVNNIKKDGNYIVITYPHQDDIMVIEQYVKSDNISYIINNIIKLTEISNNEILFVDMLINTKTNELYISKCDPNIYKYDAKIYNICTLIELIISNSSIKSSKKILYYIIGELSILIDNMKQSDTKIIIPDLNPLFDTKKNFFKKEKKKKSESINKLLIKSEKFKVYNIDGLNVTGKTLDEIKEISISNKKNIPEINGEFIDTNIIGKGLFSKVYRNGDKIIKIYKNTHIFNKENEDELSISEKINNIQNSYKYFPKYYRSFLCMYKNNISFCLEYDFVHGYNISDFLKKKKNIGNSSMIKLINNFINGNKFLNDNGIRRTDNHSNNMLIGNNHKITYIDFGRTFIVDNKSNSQLDTNNYHKSIIHIILFVLHYSLSKKKHILNILIKEFTKALSSL